MSLCCIGWVCIPMNAIWPLLLFLLQPVWGYVQKIMGWEKKEAAKGAPINSSYSCCDNNEGAEIVSSSSESAFDFPPSPFDFDESMSWDFMIQSKQPVIAKFTASWCKPCKAIAPVLSGLAAKYQGRVHICNVDVDAHEGLQSRYKVAGIPTMVALKGGRTVKKLTSSVPGEVEEFVKIVASM